MAALDRDSFAAAVVWLLDIHFAGRVYRFSSRLVDILCDDGTLLRYNGGLPTLSWEDAWALQNDSPTRVSKSFEALYFPDDIAALVEVDEHDLAAAWGELSLWREGYRHEQRHVLLQGDVVQPLYGSVHEPVSLTIERQPYNDRGLTHEPRWRVTPETWPPAFTDHMERWYPLPFGTPGHYFDPDTDSYEVTRGSPALIVDRGSGNADTLLIAGGHVGATKVRVFDEAGLNQLLNVSNTQDGLGQDVAVVDLTGGGVTIDRSSSTFWVGWTPEFGGGLLNEERSAAMEGWGEVAQWILQQTTLDVDVGRWAPVLERLNGFPVAGYIDDAVGPWAWFRERLLPMVPVDIQAGPGGLYPLLWETVTEVDAVAHITAGPGIERVGRVAYTKQKQDIINAVMVEYAYQADTREARRRVAVFPGAEPETTASEFPAQLAERSLTQYGTIAYENLSSEVVWDDNAALSLAMWRLEVGALIPREIVYRLPLDDFGWVTPGQVVTLTDGDLYFERRVARVVQRRLTPTSAELLLRLQNSPRHDR